MVFLNQLALKDKQVNMSQLGGGGGGGVWGGGGGLGYAPPEIFYFNSSQIQRNAFKLDHYEILKYKLSVLKKRYRLTKWYGPLKNLRQSLIFTAYQTL